MPGLRYSNSRFGWGALAARRPNEQLYGQILQQSVSLQRAKKHAKLWVESWLIPTWIQKAVKGLREMATFKNLSTMVHKLIRFFLIWNLLEDVSWVMGLLGISIHASWPHLREYPVGFGVRFAQTMKKFRKERSPLLRQCYVTCLLDLSISNLYCMNLDSSKFFPTWSDAA